ncbi:MAG: hypothetical protein OWT28_00410 [Firmicutes bacterium]|nr:hypothetical protein [Bacillota bacterium]
MRYTLYGIGEGVRAQTDASLWASQQAGWITDASLSARKLAVQPPLPVKTALSLIPNLLLIEEKDEATRPVSRVWERLYQFSPWLQTAGWDAFYLQITGPTAPFAELREIVQALDHMLNVEQRFRIGFAENPFLARALVEWSRCGRIPGAVYRRFGRQQVIVSPALAKGQRDWLAAMPLSPLWILPTKAKEQLLSLGIYTVADLLALPATLLRRRFGKDALVWLQSLTRQSDRLTSNYPPEQRTASFCAEQAEALATTQIPHLLDSMTQELSEQMTREGVGAKQVTLYWLTADGVQGQYIRAAKHPIVHADFMFTQLLPACAQIARPVTELSIRLDEIRPLATEQLSFDLAEHAPGPPASQKQDTLTRALLQVNRKIPGGLALGMIPSYRELRHQLTVDGSA